MIGHVWNSKIFGNRMVNKRFGSFIENMVYGFALECAPSVIGGQAVCKGSFGPGLQEMLFQRFKEFIINWSIKITCNKYAGNISDNFTCF